MPPRGAARERVEEELEMHGECEAMPEDASPPTVLASLPSMRRSAAATPETGPTFNKAGVWQLGSTGWKALPDNGGRGASGRAEPVRSALASTKLRLPLAELTATAAVEEEEEEREASPERVEKEETNPDDASGALALSRPAAGRAALAAVPAEPRLPPITPRPATCSNCNCKNSRCLKQYCVCFARGGLCGPECACSNCANNSENGDEASS